MATEPLQAHSMANGWGMPVVPRDLAQGAGKFPAHVLIVDDERLVRWAIAETLGACGYNVMEAGDAKSAMRLFTRGDFPLDLVMLDLRLPDSDDLRVLSSMRALRPTTAVIVMTSYGTPELVADARRLGATVLDKPFEMEDLLPLVRRTLASRIY